VRKPRHHIGFDLVAEDQARFVGAVPGRGTDIRAEIRAILAAQLAHPGCLLSRMLAVRLAPEQHGQLRVAARRRRMSPARLAEQAFGRMLVPDAVP
jgi:hypothetical protein